MHTAYSPSRRGSIGEVLIVVGVGVVAAACAVVVAAGGAIQRSVPESLNSSFCRAVIGPPHPPCAVADDTRATA